MSLNIDAIRKERMWNTVRRVLGLLMLATPFVLIGWVIRAQFGYLAVVVIFGTTALIVIWVVVSVALLIGDLK